MFLLAGVATAAPACETSSNRNKIHMLEDPQQNDFKAMMTAPQTIARMSVVLQRRYSLSAPPAFVAYKLVSVMARQVARNLSTPTVALEFALRMRPLLLELVLDYDSEELQRMLELVQDLIDELEHESARAEVDKLVQQWRDLLRE